MRRDPSTADKIAARAMSFFLDARYIVVRLHCTWPLPLLLNFLPRPHRCSSNPFASWGRPRSRGRIPTRLSVNRQRPLCAMPPPHGSQIKARPPCRSLVGLLFPRKGTSVLTRLRNRSAPHRIGLVRSQQRWDGQADRPGRGRRRRCKEAASGTVGSQRNRGLLGLSNDRGERSPPPPPPFDASSVFVLDVRSPGFEFKLRLGIVGIHFFAPPNLPLFGPCLAMRLD